MKNIYKYSIYIIMLLCSCNIFAQSIKIVRTDVDSARNNFITATKTFGIDIIAENVDTCTAITFELAYTNTDCIKFSDYRILNFGDSAKSQVINTINDATLQGRINAVVLSGETVGSTGYQNPAVIHLEFVVTQNSVHGTNLTFSFTNALAIVSKNGIGEILELESEDIVYRINSFISVWPGDTDNDGVVSNKDFAYISLFLGYGSGMKQLKSFKRLNASTIWQSQQVLAWDSVEVSYADCDGDGAITIYDNLVVDLNFDKTHSKIGTIEGLMSKDNGYISPETESSVLIPININSDRNFKSIAGRINYNDYNNYKILGIKNGNLFSDELVNIAVNINENSPFLDFYLGTLNKQSSLSNTGTLLYLVVEKINDNYKDISINAQNLKGIDNYGMLFNIDEITSVDNINLNKSDNEIIIVQYDNFVKIQIIENQDLYSNITMYNLQSNKVYSNDINSNTNEYIINTQGLATGVYYIVISSINGKRTHRIIIL